jgi:hypothetical protein
VFVVDNEFLVLCLVVYEMEVVTAQSGMGFGISANEWIYHGHITDLTMCNDDAFYVSVHHFDALALSL